MPKHFKGFVSGYLPCKLMVLVTVALEYIRNSSQFRCIKVTNVPPLPLLHLYFTVEWIRDGQMQTKGNLCWSCITVTQPFSRLQFEVRNLKPNTAMYPLENFLYFSFSSCLTVWMASCPM